jgi:hypothetical protein
MGVSNSGSCHSVLDASRLLVDKIWGIMEQAFFIPSRNLGKCSGHAKIKLTSPYLKYKSMDRRHLLDWPELAGAR